LKEWFVKVRNKDARMSGPLFRQKAEELPEKWGKLTSRRQMGGSIGGKKEKICLFKKHTKNKVTQILQAHIFG